MGSAEVLRRMRSYEQALGKRWTPAPVLVEMAAKNQTFYSD
jgi:3-hydroxyacyl-CoA dehydrogenase/enoyl-CoA hydratase/3-hydroxybutyryl-CoA epimerase